MLTSSFEVLAFFILVTLKSITKVFNISGITYTQVCAEKMHKNMYVCVCAFKCEFIIKYKNKHLFIRKQQQQQKKN